MPRDRELLSRLGAHLRVLREERGLTQEEVAVRAGFTAKYLSECERGLRDVPLTTLRAIVEDGLGARLGDYIAGATGDGPSAPDGAGLPRAMRALCRELAELPAADRLAVTGIARAAAGLARRR